MEIKKEKWKSSFPLTTEVKFPRSNSEVFFKTLMMEGWPSGQRQQTVNLSTYVYVGSNPTPSTKVLDRVFFVTVLSYLLNFLEIKKSSDAGVAQW